MSRPRRIACHVHTEWSFDGRWPLEHLARALRRRGYDAVLTAEHVQSLDPAGWQAYQDACVQVSTSTFLVVPGVEYRDPTNTVHVPVWGSPLLYDDGMSIGALLQRVKADGGTAVLAHPGRRAAIDVFDVAWAAYVGGIEVWNRKYDGWAPNRSACRLAERWGCRPFASLDFHGRRQFFPLSMTTVMAGELTPEAVYRALREGRLQPSFLRTPLPLWTRAASGGLLERLEWGRRRLAPLLRGREASSR